MQGEGASDEVAPAADADLPAPPDDDTRPEGPVRQ